jgi:thiamine-phosphate pyrophosphorylase
MYTPAETGQQPAPSAAMLCYVTDRRQFPGSSADQERKLLAKIAECAAAGIDLVQLREKDLTSRDLLALAEKAVACLPPGSATRLLINARTDVALASGAHGVHLPAGDLPASEARAVWGQVSRTHAVIGVSAHTPEEVALAVSHGADFSLFAPVFEKDGRGNPRGLVILREACNQPRRAAAFMPVLALGGITLENAATCFAAGASGVAAIRLFQQNPVEDVVRKLRSAFMEAKARAMYPSD